MSLAFGIPGFVALLFAFFDTDLVRLKIRPEIAA